jgi:hypothetical protein
MPDTSAPPERWDEFICENCGTGFDYRHHTNELRRS